MQLSDPASPKGRPARRAPQRPEAVKAVACGAGAAARHQTRANRFVGGAKPPLTAGLARVASGWGPDVSAQAATPESVAI
jgi:hypothetical protein